MLAGPVVSVALRVRQLPWYVMKIPLDVDAQGKVVVLFTLSLFAATIFICLCLCLYVEWWGGAGIPLG